MNLRIGSVAHLCQAPDSVIMPLIMRPSLARAGSAKTHADDCAQSAARVMQVMRATHMSDRDHRPEMHNDKRYE